MNAIINLARLGLKAIAKLQKRRNTGQKPQPQSPGKPPSQSPRNPEGGKQTHSPKGGETYVPSPEQSQEYPGDYPGLPELHYAPRPDRNADPGEVVWADVPFEEDHSQSKDRPVLIIGYDGDWLLGLPTTSVDHDRDAEQEARAGRYWVDIGSGAWDTQRRPSEVRVDRIVRIDPATIRRLGGQVSEQVFNEVAAGLRRHWSD